MGEGRAVPPPTAHAVAWRPCDPGARGASPTPWARGKCQAPAQALPTLCHSRLGSSPCEPDQCLDATRVTLKAPVPRGGTPSAPTATQRLWGDMRGAPQLPLPRQGGSGPQNRPGWPSLTVTWAISMEGLCDMACISQTGAGSNSWGPLLLSPAAPALHEGSGLLGPSAAPPQPLGALLSQAAPLTQTAPIPPLLK